MRDVNVSAVLAHLDKSILQQMRNRFYGLLLNFHKFLNMCSATDTVLHMEIIIFHNLLKGVLGS